MTRRTRTRQRNPSRGSSRSRRLMSVGLLVLFAVLLAACGESAIQPNALRGPAVPAPPNTLNTVAPTYAPPPPAASGANIAAATTVAGRVAAPLAAPAIAVASGNTNAVPNANPQLAGAKIIRNDALTLQVKDVPGVITAAGNVAADLGGYVVSSSTRGTDTDVTGEMSLRVPAEQYDTATARLRALGVKVIREESSAQDVGEEYVDLVARQKNLELSVAQLQTLLGTAKTVDDTLKVQTQLNATQSDLERVKGRVQYLDNRAALSTITLSLALTPSAQPGPTTDFGRAIADAWATSIHGLQNFALLLITVFVGGWWAILLLIAFVFLVRWLVRRREMRAQSPLARPAFASPPAFYPQAPGGIITQPVILPPTANPAPPHDPDNAPPQS